MRSLNLAAIVGFSLYSAGAQPLFLGGAIPVPFDDSTMFANQIACPRELLIDDLNGDGLPELLVAYSRGSEVRVGMSESPGEWATPEIVAALPGDFYFVDVLVGDINGDGLKDIVYCAETFEGLVFGFGAFLADPAGGFTNGPIREFEASDIGTFFGLINFVNGDFARLGDVTGDGAPDLVVPGAPLFILPGDGAGGFGEPEIISPAFCGVATLIDNNGDGTSEILASMSATRTNFSAPRMTLWRRVGGTWFVPVSLDFEDDFGFVPQFPSHSASAVVDPGITTGTRVYFVGARFDPIYSVDITPEDTMAVGPMIGPAPRSYGYGTVADVIGGSAPDLVLVDGTVFVDLGPDDFGDRQFFDRFPLGGRRGGFSSDEAFICRQITTRDVNADGETDVVLSDARGIRIRYGDRNEAGEKTLPGSRFVGALAGNSLPQTATEIGDLNGDGLADIVGASDQTRVTAYIQQEDGSFDPTLVRNDRAIRLHVADVDGDGREDVFSVGPGNSIEVRFSDPDGSFDEAVLLVPIGSGGFTEIKTVDTDGDDQLEIILQRPGGVSIFDRTQGRAFILTNEIEFPGNGLGLDIGDVDGDGFSDIVAAGGDPNAAYTVLRSRGDGTFDPPAAGPTLGISAFIQSVALGDLDADGDLDLVVAGSFGSTSAGFLHDAIVYENDATGSFLNETRLPPVDAPNTWTAQEAEYVRTADADGDGDLDIFLATARYGVIFLRHKGSFEFALDSYYGLGGYRDEPAFINQFDVADITGDGRPDIVAPDAIIPIDATNDVDGLAGVRIFPNIATPRTICPADFASPSGVLNAADLDAYVATFLSRDSHADLAAPFGILDLADIAAFVTVFVDGCD